MRQETRDFKDLIKLAITGIVLIMTVTRCGKDSGIWEVAVPGPAGVAGPQGEKGDTGEQGPQGEQGIAGTDGADGEDGADGQDGADGIHDYGKHNGLNKGGKGE